mmetsp:Transcript_46019/g.115854  ORF Transcript_46019/g.115854 Transcript_46019/m.115854 type:complete len:207 (+) Transcript_46019:1246-1866(+)
MSQLHIVHACHVELQHTVPLIILARVSAQFTLPLTPLFPAQELLHKSVHGRPLVLQPCQPCGCVTRAQEGLFQVFKLNAIQAACHTPPSRLKANRKCLHKLRKDRKAVGRHRHPITELGGPRLPDDASTAGCKPVSLVHVEGHRCKDGQIRNFELQKLFLVLLLKGTQACAHLCEEVGVDEEVKHGGQVFNLVAPQRPRLFIRAES